MSEFVSAKEVAERLSVNENVVYGWARRGVVKAVKVGGTVRINRAAFEAMLDGAREREPQPV